MDDKKINKSKSPIKEQVYLYIRDKIIKGDIEGGEFIEEEAITSIMGFSRTPVREAFLRLEAERFIDLIPRKGACVRQITGQEIINIYETRRLIEKHAVSRICKEGIAIPDEMLACHEAMKVNAEHMDFYKHIVMDGRFHGAMVEAIKNSVLKDVYKTIQDRKMRVAYTTLSLDPSRINLILNQHNEIIDALCERDIEKANDVLEKHLCPVEDIISRLPR
ncbi:GntR family transcriptional regulator [Neptunomonas sp.]|uniref:GntR family transcriptional regulator n=1 Tax=Neptunomonas sp. TaxID=1971898 RepID=UPI00356AC16A